MKTSIYALSALVLVSSTFAREASAATVFPSPPYTGASILWRNSSTGQWGTWDLSDTYVLGTTWLSKTLVPSSPPILPITHKPNNGPVIINPDQSMTAWTVSRTGTVTESPVIPNLGFKPPLQQWWLTSMSLMEIGIASHPTFNGHLYANWWIYALNESTGQCTNDVSGCGLLGTIAQGSTSDPQFAADFDGDGNTDILDWNTSTGALTVQLLNPSTLGTQLKGTQTLSLPGASYPTWLLVAAGDINGDGFADLLWWNQQTGQLVRWPTDGQGNVVINSDPTISWNCGPACWQGGWTPEGMIKLQ
jgi:hypothetical protein